MMIEILENRALLTADMALGVLSVVGSEGNDTLTVKQWGSDLVVTHDVNGVPQDASGFLADMIYHVKVNAFGGNDTVRLEIPQGMYVMFTVDGGRGNDLLIGGTAMKTQLYGGDGNDTLIATGGDNYLNGGRGRDLLKASSGENTFRGGEGNDMLVGGDGPDYMLGDAGNDTLYGNGNDDTLYGNAGRDRLYGGPGYDRTDGGAGHDTADDTSERVFNVP